MASWIRPFPRSPWPTPLEKAQMKAPRQMLLPPPLRGWWRSKRRSAACARRVVGSGRPCAGPAPPKWSSQPSTLRGRQPRRLARTAIRLQPPTRGTSSRAKGLRRRPRCFWRRVSDASASSAPRRAASHRAMRQPELMRRRRDRSVLPKSARSSCCASTRSRAPQVGPRARRPSRCWRHWRVAAEVAHPAAKGVRHREPHADG
mmetsp:Transcript_58864/g.170783  ORF Transcript_58864/g.170783 Transcript_58864/m.170783 type:complete len:203 (-) Transcript_58864:224-832(-)